MLAGLGLETGLKPENNYLLADRLLPLFFGIFRAAGDGSSNETAGDCRQYSCSSGNDYGGNRTTRKSGKSSCDYFGNIYSITLFMTICISC